MTLKTPDESPQATLPLDEEEEQEFPPGPPAPLNVPIGAVRTSRTAHVGEVMTRNVFTTFPDASLLDAALEMHHHHVTGLPVLGPEGRLVGVVTETDVMRTLGVEPETSALGLILPLGQGRTDPAPTRELDQVQRLLRQTRVGDAMTPDPVVVDPNDTVDRAIQLLLKEKVNRLPVVDQGRLVGILTRHDVLRALPPARSS